MEKKMPRSKFAPHVMVNPDQVGLQSMLDSGVEWAKVTEEVLDMIPYLVREGVDNIIIRMHFEDWGGWMPERPFAGWADHFDRSEVWRYTDPFRGRVLNEGTDRERTINFWVEGQNEPYYVWAPEDMRDYADFEVQRMHWLNERGFRSLVGGFSVGRPEVVDGMEHFRYALNNALEMGNMLHLHEYGTVYPWAWMGRNQGSKLLNDPFPKVHDRKATRTAWLFGRFQHFYEEVLSKFGAEDLPFAITETGLDAIWDGERKRVLKYLRTLNPDYPEDQRPAGWLATWPLWMRVDEDWRELAPHWNFYPETLKMDGSIRDPNWFFLELLKWMDEVAALWPQLQCMTPFSWGGFSGWEKFQMGEDISNLLAQHIKTWAPMKPPQLGDAYWWSILGDRAKWALKGVNDD
jgi:hypothetical protein